MSQRAHMLEGGNRDRRGGPPMSKENRIVLVENTPGRTARLVSRVASIPLPKTQTTHGRVHEFRECKGGPTEDPTADHCSRGSGPLGETLWALG